MKKTTPEQEALISQMEQIAEGLSQTFSPFCEVVLHDLRDPDHAILAIHNNLSGRDVGDPATELGLARIADPAYPQIIANYPNQFKDGRQVKSTSIGIKDASGQYVAALCMNIDLSLFRGLQGMLDQFGSFSVDRQQETLESNGADTIRARIDQFAARLATTPRALKAADRRILLRELKEAGLLEIRKAMETVASHLGVSRATVYTDTR
ncbi:transcriptional regulator [Pseudomonas mediterranea]|uniref:Predicted transcriptional regulator YheO, contains PAS and DNA-binding HTH domains n=1 Tax=Pseudomonas mediterranea TaxID=183795 RepID=A0AAX2DDP5_9PSED|nr:PAS domain-containing protein [Pseudomonas mediterranea]KGU83295.1 DNA-binding protein [Pseudomonas mediterranea CFBP 5447]MBL0841533.1 PAS domain-containing protein [Pseudomonas mediterranea]QHA82732.1 transcriptional regulator [Pseudomonas mediterranea]UZD98550.1 PAS domain-containing protein [Pseudomonas mediterranea]CAH0125655.1 Transcriptional regulator DauR [Pseudomonas mediterranea]